MIENEKPLCGASIEISRHNFGTLAEVVNNHKDVVVATIQSGLTRHKINTPFCKRANSNHKV
jgi:hypothetical protein